MTARMVLRGRVWWQDNEARAAAKLAAKQATAIPLDRQGQLVPPAPIAAPRIPAFRAGIPWTDPAEQVTYRVVVHVDPLGGWVSSAFLQERWLVGHREILQLARARLIDAVMAQASQVRWFRIRDEAEVLRSDPVLRCVLKRRRAVQGQGNDGRAQAQAAGARRPRRKDGRWV